MNNLVIKRSQLVEFQITGTPTTLKRYGAIPIPNLQRNNIILYGVECYFRDQLAASPSGNTVVATAQQDQVVVTFVDTNKDQFIYNAPTYSLVRANVGGFVSIFKPRVINLNDAYIQLTNAAGVNTNEVVVFNLYYQLVGE
jgi:hypothetical protein